MSQPWGNSGVSEERKAEIAAAYAKYGSVEAAWKVVGGSKVTVRKYKNWKPGDGGIVSEKPPSFSDTPAFLPDPAPEAGGPGLPDPWEVAPITPFDMQAEGTTGVVLGDTHMPFHDKRTIEACIEEARQRDAKWVLANGDMMDMAGISPFFRPFCKGRFADELAMTGNFFAWLRSRLPRARIVYKQGNHEWRLIRFLREKAEELEDLPCLQLPELLSLAKYGVEWVQDKRKVMVGKLPVMHGHEFRQTIGNVVNPARLAHMRANTSVMVNHHHRASYHQVRNLKDELVGAWSVGCACYIHPEYDPYNQWTHGYAMIDVARDGWYSVQNRQVQEGRVI